MLRLQLGGQEDGGRIPLRACRDLDEVRDGIDAGDLGGLDEAVQRGGDEGAASGLGPEMIPAPDDGAAQAALGSVVVEPDQRIAREDGEPPPTSALATSQRRPQLPNLAFHRALLANGPSLAREGGLVRDGLRRVIRRYRALRQLAPVPRSLRSLSGVRFR